ncbi:cadherin-like domain-containing protein [Fibrobacter sp. UWEL]|uniref:cadherin-like domain-containing protein n=1 Tax=Fibrobacter sp. UWEL TaxID=1896209 RepID=UPI000921D126|nr:tandem-95 repeat protein [Fibrobacter sp. UWEL]SHL34994.1 VCBS repeat-containing protein [Fibrobacter sp. UWEL]
MNKKVCLLAFGLLAGLSSAATKVVFSDEDGVTADIVPAYSFTFDYGDGASVDTTNTNGAVVIDFVAPQGKESAGAGYGFGWDQTCTTAGKCTDKAMSLTGYKGVCLEYEAEQGFRVDFKQSTITDDNYYGADLKAAASPKKVFIAFADLAQGWKSTTTKAWSAAAQMGMQFSYKNTHANTAKSDNNTVTLHSLRLADECVTAAPKLTDEYAKMNKGVIEMAEGEIRPLDVSKVFVDDDGDDLTVTVKIVSENKSVVLLDSTAYTGTSIIKFTTASNPVGSATITVTATDPTKKSATFTFTVETTDTENLPVAKDANYEVKEDSVLKVALGNSLLKKFASDADGDEIKAILVTEPKNGTLTDFNEEYGTFTYTPKKDFYGTDSFTFKVAEAEDDTRESEVATCTITVVNVNDEPEVEVVAKTFTVGEAEKTFGDTLVVDEDFEDFTITIPKANFVITDADGDDDYKVIAKNTGVYNSELSADEDNYVITVSAKKDSNGTARLSLVVEDPKTTIPTPIAVIKVNPVADPVTPVADSYKVYQDSINKVDAKKGVLANDVNPDKDTAAYAIVDFEPEHGKLTLNKDGSFTYEAEESYDGEDYFTYKVISAGDTSKAAMVTLEVLYKNKAPKIVEGVMDTVNARLDSLREDFNVVTYKKVELQSWFEDDKTDAAKLTFSATSKDSTVSVSFSTVGALLVKSVKDVCGDISFTLTATDEGKASTDLEVNANIECVNDKPTIVADTAYIAVEGDTLVYDLNGLAIDVDGDTLIFEVVESTSNSGYFEFTQEDNILTVAKKNIAKLAEGMEFSITVKVADPTMANAEKPTTLTAKLVLIVGNDPRTSIKPVIASTKMNWQGAIQATRGMAALFDMQGRVMWKSKLPVSESEVRAAAASVQGRKVLRVNKQTFTIK